MNKQTGFLLIVLMGLTVFIPWSATEPSQYMIRPGTEPAPQSYPWIYPAWMFGFGSVVIGLLSLKRPLSSFVGASLAFCRGAFLFTVFAMSAIHSPPVHDRLIYALFVTSLCLLFYSGYTCAVWRSKSQKHDSTR